MLETLILAAMKVTVGMLALAPQAENLATRSESARQAASSLLVVNNETCTQDCCSVCDMQALDAYAKQGWSTIHGDARNSGFAPQEASHALRVQWSALDGAVVKIVPTAAPGGRIYVTTGQGPGTSHLHAFDSAGHLLWESDPQTTLDDLDSGVVYSAAVTDTSGDVYVSDLNQFWAFSPDGKVKWVTPLPDPDSYMATAVLVKDRYVGGVTTNGKVALFDRQDGSLAFPILDLPGGRGPSGPSASPGLWANGLMDSAVKQTVFDSFFGYTQEVTNTPCVHPETGRIYITAVGNTPDEAVLYGIDVLDDHLQIAFQPRIVGPSGTSPVISPDSLRVYAVDANGVLIAFDAETGQENWRASGAAKVAAPAVGLDGTVYTASGEVLIALDPRDGSVRWQVNYDGLAASFLPRILPNSAFPTGLPIARTNSVVSVTPSQVWVSLVLGYEFAVPDSDTKLTQPEVTVLASVSPLDGSLTGVTPLRDTHEGVVGITSDGRILIPHSSMLTSIFYNDVNPLLPPFLRTSQPPIAGFSVLVPLSFRDHALEGLSWAQDQLEAEVAALNEEDCAAARSTLCHAGVQLSATAETLLHDTVEEVGVEVSQSASDLVRAAYNRVQQARQLLESDPSGSAAAVNEAVKRVVDAMQLLRPPVQMQVMSASCPKTLDVSKPGRRFLKVALVGTPDFDVHRVNQDSLLLSRADGIGGRIQPVFRRFGPSAIRTMDVAAVSSGLVCGCTALAGDGIMDKVMSFSRSDLRDVLELGAMTPGSSVRLVLDGKLIDGTPFRASDCIAISQSTRTGRRAR
ncbi:MAG: PQQ-binding-like beta-propeller repeat protein [Planctomycetes bacterium]|nr:PQQ-binding-like beta-propeller repeat protein [Planctomycetota bacterium]MBI3834147.1 PQQ-binding-like beta-propeller repeat protein [Planctomycetota bacterium]